MKVNPKNETWSEQQRQDHVDDLIRAANLPLRHVKTTPLWDNEWGRTFDAFRSTLGAGALLGLVGERGNGKTQLAVCLAQVVIRKCFWPARYTTATSFFMDLKATFRGESSELAVLEDYAAPSLLVIDEFGKRSGSAWEDNLMFELLHRRYNSLRDTILIDNRTVDDFVETIGPSLVSRMNEGGGLVHCDWPSFRETK
jgi:DNA replication protein DnaC